MKYKEYQKKLKSLEKEKKFDIDINAGEYLFVQNQEPNHRYIYNRFFDKVYYIFLRTIIFIFAPIVNFFTYRLKVEGRKNLKDVKKTGAIVVSNHVALLDTLMIKQAVFKRIFFIGAEHNNKKGFGGYTIKILGFLPLSSQFSNQKNLDISVSYYLSKNKLIHMAPEQAMWRGYKKIRPFKNGAFHYAVKNNVPVLPMVVLLRKPNKWDKLMGRRFKVTLKILPKVDINNELTNKEKILDLKDRVRESIIKIANEFYGEETDVEKIF